LVRDYQAGATATELRDKYGLSKGSVLKVLHDADVTMRQMPMGAELLATAIGLYEEGLTVREVGDRLDIAKTTVREALVRAGVTMRPAHRRRRP